MSGVALHAFPDEEAQARALGDLLGLEPAFVDTHRFPDGELLPRTPPAAETLLVYRSLDRPNEKLIELILAADAWRRGGVRRLVLIAPYLPYMRQDAVFARGEPVSQQVMGKLLAERFDRIITVDAHLHRTHHLADAFPGVEAGELRAADIIGAQIRRAGILPDTLVLGPDSESKVWTEALAAHAGLSALVLEKVRHGDHDVRVTLPEPAILAGRPILLVDDICSSGGTLRAALELLRGAGAGPVEIIVTHALFSAETGEMLRAAGARAIRSTDSCTHPSNAFGLAPLFAAALKKELQA